MIRFILLFAACAMIGTALDIGNDMEFFARAWACLIGGAVFAEYALQASEAR